MPEDRFKRYQDVGSDFLELARARAEEFLRELAKATESTQRQASGQVDELVAAGRRGTDQLFETIRREVSAQLSQLGLATKEDLEALERRLSGGAGGAGGPAKKAPAAKKSAAKKATTKKAPAKAVAKQSPVTKAPAETSEAAKKAAPASGPAEKAPVKKAAAKKTPATKAPAAKKAPAKKAPGTNGAAGSPTGA